MNPNKRLSLADAPVVLVVEDEPLVRLVATDFLADAGFRAIEACNADEAILLLEAKPAAVALVTDVKMPGSLDGFGLAHLVASRWPELGIVVVSGHACPGEGDLPAKALFLPKPYQPSALVEAVQMVTSSNITITPLKV